MKKNLTVIALLITNYVALAQWTPQATTITSGYVVNYIDAVSPDVCWGIVADPASQTAPVQEYTRTIDGGATWAGGTITNAAGLVAADISAINADTAWAIMFDPAGTQGKVLRTNNGGSTWAHQSTALFNAAGNFPDWIHFWDANNGVCLGDPTAGYFEIYTTMDGGAMWERVPSGNIPTPLPAGEWGIVDVSSTFGDSTVWFGTNLGRVFKSTDRGHNWTAAQTPITDYIGTIAFRDANNGIAKNGGPSLSTDLMITNDGGATWNALGTNTANLPLSTSACYVPGTDSTYFMGGTAAGVGSAYSPDGGINWILADALYHNDIEFVNDSIGWTGSGTIGGLVYKWLSPIVTVTQDVAAQRIGLSQNIGLTTQSPTAQFFNNGLITQSFNVTMTITGGYSSTKTITNLAFFDSIQVTFDPWIPTLAGPHTVSIYTSLVGDVNNSNDTLNKAVQVYEQFENYGWVSKPDVTIGSFGSALAFFPNGLSSSGPGTLYSIGGSDLTTVQAGINTFSDATNLWSSGAAMPSEKYQFSALRAGNKIVCAGGYAVQFTPDAATYIYDIATGTWSTGAPMPTPVGDYASGVYHDSIIYYIGGYDGGTSISDVQFYNVNTNTWNTATAKSGDAVYGLRGGVVGDKIIVAGGFSVITGTTTAAAYQGLIDPNFPTQITWTSIADYPSGPVFRLGAGTPFNDFKPLVIFAAGSPTGNGTDILNDCWGYDVNQNGWFIGASKITAVNNITDLAGVIYNDSLWMASVAGYNGTNLSTVNEWLNVGPMVWSGIHQHQLENTLGIYPNPVEDELIVTGNFSKGKLIINLENVLGQIVLQQQKHFNTAPLKLNIAMLATGVYTLKIEDVENKLFTSKVIKQ